MTDDRDVQEIDAPRVSAPPRAEFGSDILVDLMKAYDIEYASLNPGATFRGLHDSMVNYGGNRRPQLILCCHEEIAVSVAHGYTKARGRPMIAIVHDIVGLLHASMAVYLAWLDQAPVLVFGGTGPMAVEHRRPGIDWIHTALVQGDVVRDYVKWDDQPASLQSAVESFIRGHRIAMSDPRGPIYLCFDTDIQEARLEEQVTVPDVDRYGPAAPAQADPTMLATAAKWLIEAEHPVVLADYMGRNQKTVPDLVELAELLALPVIDLGSRYNFPNMHSLDATEAEDQLLPQADVVLALDVTDLQWATSTVDRTSRLAKPYLNPRANVIHISVRDMNVRAWAQEHGRLHPVDLPITADTSLAIPALTALCRATLERTPGARERVTTRAQRVERIHRSLQDKWRETAKRKENEHPISLPRLATELGDVVKDEDWMLVNRTLRDWTRRLWDWSKPTLGYVGAHRGGGVGYGIGHSIGAALAVGKERLCIDIQPDGDLLFTPSALWTAAHHRIPLLIVMFNNRSYYNDEDHQILMAKARTRPVENSGIGLHMVDPPVDFATMAKGFGIEAWGPIEDPSDLKPVLERAVRYVLKERKAALVDVVTQAR